ncbi:hypothetical protein OF83DRAFT_446763 [Amylostereum chailletii]|nr:hypothetical protein OF83DRAFT_446763 [Amylostereum chailletii]
MRVYGTCASNRQRVSAHRRVDRLPLDRLGRRIKYPKVEVLLPNISMRSFLPFSVTFFTATCIFLDCFFARANADQLISPELISFVDNLVQEQRVPGLVLGIVSGTQSAIHGWGNSTEDGDPMTENTIFNLASCSKAFTAACLGILIDDYANGRKSTPLPSAISRLGWDTKAKDLLPDE